jgi:hypothetical protein
MNFHSLALLLVGTAGVAVACSHPSSTSTTAGAAGSGGGSPAGSGGGGSATCPADAHDDPDAGCVASITWAMGPKVPTARNHHHTWIADQGAAVFLYVAGGSDANSDGLSDVQRAPVNADGTLGPWAAGTSLPDAIIGAGVALIHGEVVLAGGYGLSTTWISAIQPDASMGPWKAGPPLPGAWFHTTAVAFQDFVYVIGGLDGTTEENQVVRSLVASDGTLGAWQPAATLPYALSHHASVVSGTTLYVLGGESVDGVPRDDVLSAPLAADGSIGAWKHELSLPSPVETHSAFVHDGSLYVVGGIVGPSLASSAAVVRSPLAADGTLGAWVTDASSALPHARSHVHQTPVRQTWVYSVAGAPTGFPSVTDETDVGTFH